MNYLGGARIMGHRERIYGYEASYGLISGHLPYPAILLCMGGFFLDGMLLVGLAL